MHIEAKAGAEEEPEFLVLSSLLYLSRARAASPSLTVFVLSPSSLGARISSPLHQHERRRHRDARRHRSLSASHRCYSGDLGASLITPKDRPGFT